MSNHLKFDIEDIRNDTPGCCNVLHLNNAGASLVTKQVLSTVITHLQKEAEMGSYEAAHLKAGELASVYTSLATLINAHPEEIAVCNSATQAWNLLFYSIGFKSGDIILASSSEYISNRIAYLQLKRKCGVNIQIIPDDENGQASVTALENMLSKKVKLISLTHVPSNNGLVQPAAAIGKIANQAGILYLLDACQSVGQMSVDVRKTGCDFLSAAGRKYLRGPRGTGFLFVRKELISRLEEPWFLDFHAARLSAMHDSYEIRSDAKRFENWEFNIASKLGLGAAADYAINLNLSNTYPYIQSLARELRIQLSGMAGITVYDKGAELCGIVTFTVNNITPLKIKELLLLVGINVSATEAVPPFHGSGNGHLPALVRASVHYYNTHDEIIRFAEALQKIIKSS